MQKITFSIDHPEKKDIYIPLLNYGQEVELYGLVEAESEGDYEINIVMDHRNRGTYGRVLVKGTAINGARVKVNGLVKIEKDASKTDSYLTMKMLILDEKSMATVEPRLEIENNDVKASHSATVGKIDDEQLFYLISRGISLEEARKLIINGFLEEIKKEIIN